jgi:SAM-dependent methyltransferase
MTNSGIDQRIDSMKPAIAYPGVLSQPDHGERGGALLRAVKRVLRAQFGRPSGWIGTLVGRIMVGTPSNLERTEWTVALLDVKPSDRVLEIGFGPGLAIELLASQLPRGFVAGIDHSEVMVRQASKRNAEAIREGRVSLQVGSASAPPAFSQPFDAIFTINSIHFWNEPEQCLAGLRTLLRPGGRVAVTLQPRSHNATDETARIIGEELVATLERAGFSECRLHVRPFKPVAVACVLGVNR